MRNTALALQNMQDSQGVRAMLREIVQQLGDHCAGLESVTISDVLYCLQDLPDCEEVRAVLRALLPHLIRVRERGVWLSAEEIAGALNGLQDLSAIPEVNGVLDEIALHILAVEAQNKLMSNAQLAKAFYGLCNMQATAQVRKVVQALYSHLHEQQAVDMNTFWHIVYGLGNMQDDDQVRVILATLIPDLQGYARAFEPLRLGLMLDSLKRLAYVPEAITIYELLLPQIIAAGAELDSRALGEAFFLLEFLPDSSKAQQWTSIFFTSVLKRIQNLRKSLDSGTIAYLLCSIQKLPLSAEIGLMLAGLRKHLDKNAQAGQRMSEMEILNALSGLQYITVSEEVEKIVAALTRHISPQATSSWTLLSKRRWLADIIYSLRQHFSGQHDATIARHFLQAMARARGLEFDTEQLHENTLMEQIISLGQYVIALPDGGIQLDITNSSTLLSQVLCKNLLAGNARGEIRYLTVVFALQEWGNSPRERYYREKKHALIRSILTDEVKDWGTIGQVTVREPEIRRNKRGISALPQVNQAASTAQQEPALKRVKTEPALPQASQSGVDAKDEIDVEEETDSEEEVIKTEPASE